MIRHAMVEQVTAVKDQATQLPDLGNQMMTSAATLKAVVMTIRRGVNA